MTNQLSAAEFNCLPTPALLPGQRTKNITQEKIQHINYASQMLHDMFRRC